MFNSTNTPFTMPVMPATGGYADGAGWGDGGWLWIIVVFALLFGWGNNGFGNGFGNGGGYAATVATQADIQRGFDTQNIVGKLDGINNGLCDGFYAQNTALMNGFHGIDNAICNLGYQTQQGFNTTELGIDLYENDIVECCGYRGVIKFEDGAFVIEWIGNGTEFLRKDLAYWAYIETVIVTGNAFETSNIVERESSAIYHDFMKKGKM